MRSAWWCVVVLKPRGGTKVNYTNIKLQITRVVIATAANFVESLSRELLWYPDDGYQTCWLIFNNYDAVWLEKQRSSTTKWIPFHYSWLFTFLFNIFNYVIFVLQLWVDFKRNSSSQQLNLGIIQIKSGYQFFSLRRQVRSAWNLYVILVPNVSIYILVRSG